ncbi:MAG: cyclase family protein [Actinomycetota bacterium]|nr:cyclase family protein [Actinomycetota bacterium]
MDDLVQELVSDFKNGFLTRRGFLAKAAGLGLSAAGALALLSAGGAQVASAQGQVPGGSAQAPRPVQPKGWVRGRGWGWVWGPNDELGNLNELSPELTMKALSMVRRGRVYDLGLMYDRRSFRWPGHSPGEILTFRSQQGEMLQRDLPFVVDPVANSLQTTFASCALFISDNVATQIDSFGHISFGDDPTFYNGNKARDVVGDWGLLKLGADTIPPIIAPATLVDIAGYTGMNPLPANFVITPDLIQQTLAWQGVDIDVLDVVLIRTGTAAIWMQGEGVGANQADVARHDSAGINLAAARWLVEEKGALMIGSDTSGLEVATPVDQLEEGTSFIPVHTYLIPKQGVHILEYNNCEELAAERTYKFAYVLGVNKLKGTTAGTALRPIGIA